MKSTIKKSAAVLLALMLTLTSVMLSTTTALAASGDTLKVNVTSNIFPSQTQIITDFESYQNDDGEAFVTVEYNLLGTEKLLINFQGVLTWENSALEYKEEYNQSGTGRNAVLNFFPFAVSQGLGSGTVNTFDDGNTGKIAANFSSVSPAAEAFEGDGTAVTVVKAVFRVLNRNTETTVNLDVNTLALCDKENESSPYTQYFLVNNNTVNEDGAELATCTAAVTNPFGEQSGTEDVEDTNLNIKRVDAQLMHKLHMRYFTGEGDFSNYENVYILIRNTSYDNGTTCTQIDGVLENGRYKFEYDMLPTQMTDIMELTVYATDTTDQKMHHSTAQNTTVASYLYNRLKAIKDSDNQSDTLLRSTIVDLLNYGSALQVMLNYHTDNLANTRLKNEYPNYNDYSLSDYEQEDEINTLYQTIDNPQMWFSSHTLFFDDSINPVIYFKATKNGREMTDTDYLDVVISGISTKVYLKDLTYESQQQRYMYMFTDLTSNQVDRNIFFTLRDKDGNALSNTMSYNVSSNLPRRVAGALSKGTVSSAEEYYNSPEGQALIYTIKFGRSAKMLGDFQA